MTAPATEGDPDLGVPRAPARRAAPRAARPRRHPRGLRAARLRARSRPAPSSRSSGCSARVVTPTRRSTASAASPATTAGEDAALGLHFDLTVPFARYVLENAGQLAFPFRRYQIQKVWRGERPQEGRFREFTQADIDVVDVGELAPHFEAEMPLVIAEAFRRLPVGEFRIQVNNRKIPEGFYLGIGLTDVVGHAAHRRQARQARRRQGHRDARWRPAPPRSRRARCWRWRRSAAPTCPSWMPCAPSACSTRPSTRASTPSPPSSRSAWSRHRACSWPTCRIARGLDYYTGTVYETQLVGSESWGSVCSGGRYDSLASDGRTTYPGVGISIGADPARAPARRQARAHGQPLDAGGRARRRRRRGDPRRPPGGWRRRCGRAASRARWRRAPRSSASRSGTPTGAASRSSGSRAPGDGRRPGQGHPLGRAGRRRRRDVAVPGGRTCARPSSRRAGGAGTAPALAGVGST